MKRRKMLAGPEKDQPTMSCRSKGIATTRLVVFWAYNPIRTHLPEALSKVMEVEKEFERHWWEASEQSNMTWVFKFCKMSNFNAVSQILR